MFWKSQNRRQKHTIDSVPMQVQLLEDRQLLSGATGGQAATPPQDELESSAAPVVICCDAEVPCDVVSTNVHSDTAPPNGGMTGVADDAPSQANHQALIDLIENTKLDDWDTVGGQADADDFEPTLKLVTRQTQAIHEKVADRLAQFRRLQDLQITVEVRFITLQDNFFERIGVDFDFNVNDTIGGPIDNGLFDQTSTNELLGGNGGNQADISSDNDDASEEESDQETDLGDGLIVQQPIVGTISVDTVVSVPDGGTVLLGGIKRLREGRTDRGVPLLNKIPYVSRLFRNSGIGRETQSLMLMVTPRIIIQE